MKTIYSNFYLSQVYKMYTLFEQLSLSSSPKLFFSNSIIGRFFSNIIYIYVNILC